MKKMVVAIILAVLILVGSFFLVVKIFGSMTQYNIEEMTTVVSTDVTEAESSTEDMSQLETTSEEVTTDSTEEETTEETTEVGTTQEAYEVELSISMPEKNGTMVTDKSENNKYIKTVTDEKDIDADLLLAVFSVPESGQNYVFEFYDEKMTADNIRRVYLIDSDGRIASVAATKANEKVNLTTIENWFCMNVLIKEVVFPAISEDIK